MSYRHMDPGMVRMVNELFQRVRALERMETNRYTSIRIGNLMLEQMPAYPADPTHLRITNMRTGTITDVPI
jgi:hypothetical protein